MAMSILQSSSLNTIPSLDIVTRNSNKTFPMFGSQFSKLQIRPAHLSTLSSFEKLISFKVKVIHAKFDIGLKRDKALRLKASMDSLGVSQETAINKQNSVGLAEKECDIFSQMKHHFLSFKKDTYLENLEHFQNLASGQSPKFMVVACADSRVCPSTILGFQPGEAFVVRNVANLVPPFQNGPSETNAALEFAVNSLEVENILVVGHSCCGGIRALMSMQDDSVSSDFIPNWVKVGMPARLSTNAAASNLQFDQQCRHCEKESINHSLLNLLSYPWIEEKVRKGKLAIHGGYYDFTNCTFEKWTLDYEGSHLQIKGSHSVKDREIWC